MWVCVTAMCGVTILHGPLVTAQVCPVPPLREHLTFMVLVKPKVNENGEAEPSQDRTSPFPTPIHVPKPSGLCLTDTGLNHWLSREGGHLAEPHLIQPAVIKSVENIKSHSWVMPATSAASAPRFLLAGSQAGRFSCG